MFDDAVREQLERWVEYEPNTGCHLWFGVVNSKGYGRVTIKSRLYRAHRVAFEIENGPIPDGLSVLHRCDTPSCVNPLHLRAGTTQENQAEKATKGRARKVAQKGEDNPRAILTEEQVREIRALKGVEIQRLTAERFGVGRRTIRNIQGGLRWAHIAD